LAANTRLFSVSRGGPHFAGAEGLLNPRNAVENTGKPASRGAKRRGGRTTTYNLTPDKKQQQTFELILPSLIHKSEKGNLS
jgi:hypothetical protein